ncbi:Hsp70 family protein [Rutstroemia sp. NJR-2017a BBW]|nr:Hsp70 family protein [Rutstroemia sp. NJR-2017a BBW]
MKEPSRRKSWRPDMAQKAKHSRNRSGEASKAASGSPRHQGSMAPRINMATADVPMKVVIGLDYGTTFTSVSYSIVPVKKDNARAFSKDIMSVVNWPHDGQAGERKQLPSESWYSPTPIERNRTENDEVLEENVFDSFQGNHALLGKSNLHTDSIEDSEDSEMEDELSLDYLWGYGVPYEMYKANSSRSQRRYVKRAKLMLVETEYTNEDRKGLRAVFNGLLKEEIIRRHGRKSKSEPDMWDAVDPISDYLVKVLEHTKDQLQSLHGFTQQSPVDFVMTVPTVWSPEASRVLQTAVKAAIYATSLGKPGGTTADNLFLISEPEAAATFLLENSDNISLGEIFIIADCGGGTVDVVTYGVSNRYPLRLKEEKIPPIGSSCGSSYLNDNYRTMLHNRLQDEHYLLKNGETLDSIVNRLIPDFENEYKRRVNVVKPCGHRVYIAGLRSDEQMDRTGPAAKRFETNNLLMNRSDYEDIFMPLLHRISGLLDNQIEQAVARKLTVKKVFLVGGFAGSPSLRTYLKRHLDKVNEERNLDIELVADKQKTITAVASGSVLRAIDKKNGPQRISQSSYGFLRAEPWQPEQFRGHANTQPRRSKLDGDSYVHTINYFMIKAPNTLQGKSIAPDHKFESFPTYHISISRILGMLVCFYSYLSFLEMYSHNTDAQIAGRIVVDMTFLREKGIIQPIEPEDDKDGIEHYRVDYELVAIVEGRALRYEARWPAGEDGQVQGSGQLSIAAAFKEGTA